MSEGRSVLPAGAPDARKMVSVFALHRRSIGGAFALTLLLFALGAIFLHWRFDVTADVLAPSGGSGATSSPSEALAERLTSPDLVTRTVDALGLSERSDFVGSADAPLSLASRRYAAVAAIQQRLRVSAGDHPQILTVHLAVANRLLAVRALDDLLMRAIAAVGAGSSPSRRELENRVAAARQEAADRQQTFEQAQVKAAKDEATRVATAAQLSTIAAQRTAAQAIEADATAAVVAAGVSGSVAAPTSPILRGLIADQAQASAQMSQLGQQFGPLHPKMVAAQQQLTQISLRISNEMKSMSGLLAAAQAARRRLAALGEASPLAEDLEVASAVPLEQLSVPDVMQLKQAAEAARGRYLELLGALQRPSPAARMSIKVLQGAHAPVLPSDPNPVLFTLAALLTAVLAAAATLLLRERLQPGFKTPAEVGKKLELGVVALIPDVTAGGQNQAEARPIDLLDNDPAFAGPFASIVAEFASEKAQCVAICSAVPNEGKTTVSICFARAAARVGLRVVLVDCDGRRRELSRLVAPSAGGGLVQLIRGSVSLDVALVNDSSSGAWVIPHSSDRRIETELFATAAKAEALLGELLARFDLVILDTAPVLALEETRLLASLADAVLLVARWRKTPIAATRIARDILVKAKARIAAVALTRVRFA